MKKITYGTPGLVDWAAQIKAGAAKVRVHFTGGALTQYGVTPAEYTTSNPFIQKVIEQSDYYKSNRIITVREVNIDTATDKTAVKAKTETSKPKAQQPKANEPTDGAKPEAVAMQQVEVGCLQDAQAYLSEHFKIASYKVRTYADAQKAANERGVVFTGGNFSITNKTEEVAG